MIPCSVEDIENEVYNKTSLIIFTERTHGKLDAVPLASEPQASRPAACGAGLWPTGLLAHRLAAAAASARRRAIVVLF